MMKASIREACSRVCTELGQVALRVVALAVFVMLCTLARAGQAQNSVSIDNGVDPPFVVLDGGIHDLDPDADEIEVQWTLADGINNDWVAEGVVYAKTTNPAGAEFIVTEVTITNITGEPINAAFINVQHDFPPFVSFTQMYTGHVDGTFDKIGGGHLGNFQFDYQASMTGKHLGGMNWMDGLKVGPIHFDWTGLPMHEDTITWQRQEIIFYMDEIDNFINLPNSATILPTTTVAVEEAHWSAIKELFR